MRGGSERWGRRGSIPPLRIRQITPPDAAMLRRSSLEFIDTAQVSGRWRWTARPVERDSTRRFSRVLGSPLWRPVDERVRFAKRGQESSASSHRCWMERRPGSTRIWFRGCAPGASAAAVASIVARKSLEDQLSLISRISISRTPAGTSTEMWSPTFLPIMLWARGLDVRIFMTSPS